MSVRPAALLTIVALLGCGAGDPDNHGYGWEYDAETASGWRVSWSRAVKPGDWGEEFLLDPAWYERKWQRMQDCTGIRTTVTGMYVVLMPRAYLNARYGTGGQHHHSPPLIVVDETGFNLSHEIGHRLKLAATGDGDRGHTDPMFKEGGCTHTVAFP